MKKCRFCDMPLEGLGVKIINFLFKNKESDVYDNVCKKCEYKIERRQFKRFLVKYETGIRHLDDIDFTSADIKDLSEGGVKLETQFPCVNGRAVHGKIFLEHIREYIDFVGSIVWNSNSPNNKKLAGIKFKYLNPGASRTLKNTVEELKKISQSNSETEVK